MVNERTGIFKDSDSHPAIVSPFGWGRTHDMYQLQKRWWVDGSRFRYWGEATKVYSRDLMVW